MKLKTILASFVIATGSANAAVTVSISTAPTGAQFFLAGNTTVVTDNNHFRIGTFSVAPVANATFEVLAATFQEFAFTTTGSTSAPNTGRTNKTNIPGAASGLPDSDFVGDKIYVWVYNQPSPNAAGAPAPSSTLQQGVFSTTVTTATFKDQATAVALSTANLDQAFGMYVGGSSAATSGATGQVARLTLAAIPEASSAALMLLALGAFTRRKR